MDDLLVRVLVRLLRIHDELGERAFQDAGNRALVAIARAAHVQAEHMARDDHDGVVVPIHHARPRQSQDDPGRD